MQLSDLARDGAFVYLHPDHDWLAVQVSGPYLTLMVHMPIGYRRGNWEAPDGANPLYHDLGRDGLHGADAADLVDACQQYVEDYLNSTGPWAEDDEEVSV